MGNRTKSRLRWSCSNMLIVGWLLFCVDPVRSQDESGPIRLNDSHLLSGSVVRWAFRDVADTPRTWTVRLLNEKQESALGVIVGADGWIVTKGSELRGKLTCRLADGRQFDAHYVGYHPQTDVALVKIEATGLPVVEWSENTDPLPGQWLITPGTGARPVAVGVVSVQRRVLPRQPIHGVLGIGFQQDVEYPVVGRVFEGSAAESAGLQPGDRILKVNAKLASTREQVAREIFSHRPGDKVTLLLERNSERMTITARLTHPPTTDEWAGRIQQQNAMGGDLSFRRDDFPTVIQHDSVIQPADCGGPVVNISGKAVGINIARAGRTESYALPHDILTSLIEEMKSGRFPPPEDSLPPRLDDHLSPPAPELPQLVP